MFGKLTLHAFKHDLVQTAGVFMILLTGLAVMGFLTYTRRWKWLWKEWLTSLDPKKIGVMYLVLSFLMLLKGAIDALMIRIQQAWAVGASSGYLESDHFQQIFTAHGTSMIFFVAMGLIFALMNLIVPLQIGARDVAFPFLNAMSFWFFAVGSALVILSMVIGNFSATGWVAYPPLSGILYSPGEGVDYWIWSVQISGIGSLLSGVNFFVTIFKMRCPGMTLLRMPLLVWAVLGSVVLIIFAFPILTATIGLLSLDRLLGTHFFTSDFGGNPMMYINLIWAWGHPEVYILVLPAFGIYSEVVSTFSQKRMFGYVSMVWAIGVITLLSFIVWLHHFFTMGAGPNVNAFFGVMTILIAVPTGVKIFNWLFTMYRGRIQFSSPMLWFLGFVITFTTGGMTGVLMSVAPVDFQAHNSLFLIAHFHSMIIGGVVFAFFAAITYWFPKFTGFKLNEKLGKYAFYCWFSGFMLAFMPLYILGLMGATRRLDHYEASTGWQPLFIVAAAGVGLIFLGVGFQLLQLFISIKERNKNRDLTGNPWKGGTLEWATASPPPEYNFAKIPTVNDYAPLWSDKKLESHKGPYKAIEVPKNSPLALYIGGSSFLIGWGLIWHMFWLVPLGIIGTIGCLIVRLYDKHHEVEISAKEVAKIEGSHLKRGG